LAAAPAAVTSFDLSRSAARAPQVATVAETSEPVVEPVARVVPVRAEPKPEPVKPAPVRQGVKPAPGKKPSFAELFEDFGKASTAPTPPAARWIFARSSLPHCCRACKEVPSKEPPVKEPTAKELAAKEQAAKEGTGREGKIHQG
jgi:hypothetical protein